MATRKQFYKHFGPKWGEAIVRVILDQVNTLRGNDGLSEITPQQVLDTLEDMYVSLSDINVED